ncbi:MAG: capsular polysaccharide biosynthesis protein [Pseudomonadota bacterium]
MNPPPATVAHRSASEREAHTEAPSETPLRGASGEPAAWPPETHDALDPVADPTLGGGRALIAQPGLLANAHALRVLRAAGWRLGAGGASGTPTARTHLAIWGRKSAGAPARQFANGFGIPLLTLEDGFLHGIRPPMPPGARHRRGPLQPPPLSLLLDDRGIHIDASRPSRLEGLIAALSAKPLPPSLMARAAAGLSRLQALGLSKFTPVARGALALPPAGYVLVIDQTAGDAAVHLGGAGPGTFRAMLAAARAENPGARIVVKTHPATANGRRAGHLSAADLAPGDTLLDMPVNPVELVEGAARVYAVSSLLGYEAILAGRETHVFGLPFYAGWGLSRDRLALPRFAAARAARPCRHTLFAATHLLGPLYWCPYDQRLASFEETLDTLEALAGAEQRDSAAGKPLTRAVYAGFAPWKQRHAARFGPAYPHGARFHRRAARGAADRAATGEAPARLWVWASHADEALCAAARQKGVPTGLVEDGFLRSVGLGARLTDAASLVFDDLGMHYDPARPSRLEALIEEAAGFAADDPRLARAEALLATIRASGVTKYNLDHSASARRAAEATLARLPGNRPVLLVPGQVADDASVRLGAASAPARDNLGLLAAARAAAPEAFVVYKPHPDVEAGLRAGALPAAETARYADLVAADCPAAPLLARADGLWTLTSLMGFEALIRGVPVTCLGAPFYAGWGLTRDVGPTPARRTARPGLAALAWAALIAYPRYLDPHTRLAAPPELVLRRLAEGRPAARGGAFRRALSLGQDTLGSLGLVRWR